jgi:hypothetical protein
LWQSLHSECPTPAAPVAAAAGACALWHVAHSRSIAAPKPMWAPCWKPAWNVFEAGGGGRFGGLHLSITWHTTQRRPGLLTADDFIALVHVSGSLWRFTHRWSSALLADSDLLIASALSLHRATSYRA